ncbi:MAG: hypothetical protein WCF67_03925 [Chitinophagaceae bacterium]
MKSFFQTAVTAACLSAFLFASCKKTVQDVAAEEKISAPDPGKKAKLCNIEEIIVNDPSYANSSAVFVYNQKGDPVTVTPFLVGTGRPRHEFRYDKKHRMTDYIGAYTNGFFEFWYKYTYDNHNKIIKDTQFVFGTYGAEPTNSFYVRVTDYTYDSEDRIIQTNTTQLQPDVIVFSSNYSYDANGNRVGDTYDNRIHFRRTNPIWMFIDRNYSVNNPVAPTSYNSIGLPTSYNQSQGSGPSFLLGTIQMHQSTIIYDCKGNITN